MFPFAWQSNKSVLFFFTQNSVSEIQFGTGIQRSWAFVISCTNMYSHQQSTKVSSSLHPLQHSSFLVCLIIAILTGVRRYSPLRFWVALLWWLVMISIFLCTHWLSVCLPWKNVYSELLPILKIRLYRDFCYWTVWGIFKYIYIYIVRILVLIRYIICNNFLPLVSCLFYLLLISFTVQKLFSSM